MLPPFALASAMYNNSGRLFIPPFHPTDSNSTTPQAFGSTEMENMIIGRRGVGENEYDRGYCGSFLEANNSSGNLALGMFFRTLPLLYMNF